METPLVSVIIPCYNQARFLNDAVRSVLECGYDNTEIIVVNDGSTDPADDRILREFSAPKTRVIHQKNKGLPSARNAAIEAAKGKYILPLDADDMTAPGFIGEAVAVLEKDPEVCVVTGWLQHFGQNRELHKPSPCESLADELRRNHLIVSSLYRRSDWEKAGGYSPEMKYGMEDWEFWISLMEATQGRVTVLPQTALHYRIHETSMFRDMASSQSRKQQMLATIVRLHQDAYLSRLDVLADFICLSHESSGPKNPYLPARAKMFVRKYLKYKKISTGLILLASVLFMLTTAAVLSLVFR